MALDTLEVFGVEYQNVAGFKATDDNGNTKTYIRPQGTKSISANGTGIDVTEYAAVDVAVTPPSPSLQTKTKSYTPTESAQSESVTADGGYDGLDTVSISVGAISSTYVGSGIARKTSSDLTVSGATVTVPSGYYENGGSTSVASGTEGTPTATKGTVSSHSITVTPSVTNSAGYITGSTKTGTAVTVSASELVSGSETKTANGTYDVTNLASLIVNVSGGKNIQYYLGRDEVARTAYTSTDVSVKVSKAGTYKCAWSMDRNTSSGTNGSRLYKNDTAVGTAHTSWTHNGAECEESLTLAVNDVITVYARSRSTSYYVGVSNLILIEQ